MPIRFRLRTIMIAVAIAAGVMALVVNGLMLPVLAWAMVSFVVSTPMIATAVAARSWEERGRPVSPTAKLALLVAYTFLAGVIVLGLIMAGIVVRMSMTD